MNIEEPSAMASSFGNKDLQSLASEAMATSSVTHSKRYMRSYTMKLKDGKSPVSMTMTNSHELLPETGQRMFTRFRTFQVSEHLVLPNLLVILFV